MVEAKGATATREEWLSIAEAAETATGAWRALDARIAHALGYAPHRPEPASYFLYAGTPFYTSSLDAITGAIEGHLPGWAWKVGTCSVSDDGCVCPDWNSPEHGARLRAELGEPRSGHWTDIGFDVDKRPSGWPALALCAAFARAMAAKIPQEK